MTLTTKTEAERERLVAFDREMLRSAFVSMFWSVISDRKRRGGYMLQTLADALGCHKSAVSRWFSNEPPNWTLDTVADIAGALDVELHIEARDRQTGIVHTAAGPMPTVHVYSGGQIQTTTTASMLPAQPVASFVLGSGAAIRSSGTIDSVVAA